MAYIPKKGRAKDPMQMHGLKKAMGYFDMANSVNLYSHVLRESGNVLRRHYNSRLNDKGRKGS